MYQLAIFPAALSTASSSSYGNTRAPQIYLSTFVDDILWISVYKQCFNHLGSFLVDSRWIKSLVYTQVIHIVFRALNRWKITTGKKKLDQLSTYPQSLLKRLYRKI